MNQILSANYWEHFKYAKDLALFLPVDHPKRVKIEREMENMLKKLNSDQNPERIVETDVP